ncbi:hypothetical protein GCM10023091_09430 [Ravibacter arvi]|uniref:Uncharacterized protein n=1 Tax=Ravibacter arvi TaxID=2051041 RepID=A0ABP8LRM9_9BACT
MKTLNLIFRFYKSFCLATLLPSAFLLYSASPDVLKVFGLAFKFKILSLILVLALVYQYKRSQFYYYRNLGLSRNVILVSVFMLDMMIFLTGAALLAKSNEH